MRDETNDLTSTKMLYYKILLWILLFIFLFLGFFRVASYTLAPTIPIAEAETVSVVVQKYTDEFIRIGGCESVGNPYGKWDYHAKNPYSSASGVFQFINSSWYYYGKEFWGEDFYDKNIWTENNIELAWYVYKKYGTNNWNESRSCWSIKN